MFLKIPVCTRSCAEESLSRAPGADFGGQEGAPRWPKWSPNPARKRVGSGLKFQLVLEAVLEAVLRPEKGRSRSRETVPAAGQRNGGGVRGGIKGGGLKHCKEFSELSLTRPQPGGRADSSGLRHSADPQKERERATIVEVIYWPSAHPATVPGWWVRGLLSVRWDRVVGLSAASGRQF